MLWDNSPMKRTFPVVIILLAVAACSPVLNREVMNRGVRDVPFSQLRQVPEVHKGKLFILGGLIVETRLVEKGSQIEALNVPVDSLGYLEGAERTQGRFLALYPGSKGLLDPIVYRKGREITIAGEFIETRKGKIDELEYVYPVFEIREIYLWEERKDYYPSPYHYPYYDPFYYRSPFLYDPWGRPYPNPYWPPPQAW
jgi:outer membrane lipoprotein